MDTTITLDIKALTIEFENLYMEFFLETNINKKIRIKENLARLESLIKKVNQDEPLYEIKDIWAGRR